MKKLRLRNWVKVVLTLIIVEIAFMGFLLIASNRFEKIENGEMTLVSQSEMDR